MRLLCDIQAPTSGSITLDGKNISELGERYRNLLGYLPQILDTTRTLLHGIFSCMFLR